MTAVKNQQLIVLGSDILAFEVYNILSEEKRNKVQDYLTLCTRQIENYDDHGLFFGKALRVAELSQGLAKGGQG